MAASAVCGCQCNSSSFILAMSYLDDAKKQWLILCYARPRSPDKGAFIFKQKSDWHWLHNNLFSSTVLRSDRLNVWNCFKTKNPDKHQPKNYFVSQYTFEKSLFCQSEMKKEAKSDRKEERATMKEEKTWSDYSLLPRWPLVCPFIWLGKLLLQSWNQVTPWFAYTTP